MSRGSRLSRGTARCAGLVVLALVLAAVLPGLASAGQGTVWLCKPGLKHNPCDPGLDTTRLSNNGKAALGEYTPGRPQKPKVDCFYLYPTVSDDESDNSDLSIDPEERSIALYQAARYSQVCRVFAPMYRQITLTRLLNGPDTITPKMQRIAYRSALSGWHDYLKNYNHDRPFVLIGHSQGSFTLRRLIGDEIDGRPALRNRLISAVLLGGNVLVKKNGKPGGDFQNIPPCTTQSQLHCVVAFSTFNERVPQDAVFGRNNGLLGGPIDPTLKVLCAYPGSRQLKTIVPTEPFAPQTTIGVATSLVGFPKPNATTTWAEYDHAYTGACSSAIGANVLHISGNRGAPHLNSLPDATWGLHLTDANIALGNLVHAVQGQIDTYFQPTPGWEGFVTNPESGCKARVQVPYLDQGRVTAYTQVACPRKTELTIRSRLRSDHPSGDLTVDQKGCIRGCTFTAPKGDRFFRLACPKTPSGRQQQRYHSDIVLYPGTNAEAATEERSRGISLSSSCAD
ncbi:MAG: DUF3089 domain-containing protein [Solirubrobacterales bacterium]